MPSSKIYAPSSAFEDAVYLFEPWPKYLNGKDHSGIDIYAQKYKKHKPVATEPGKVIKIFKGSSKRVSFLELEGEATGTIVIYKHLQTILKVGDKIDAGQLLGTLDDSGKDAGYWGGYHVHFQVRMLNEGKENDPVKYLLDLMPKIKWFMRDKVLKVYKDREYFSMMNIKPRPWE